MQSFAYGFELLPCHRTAQAEQFRSSAMPFTPDTTVLIVVVAVFEMPLGIPGTARHGAYRQHSPTVTLFEIGMQYLAPKLHLSNTQSRDDGQYDQAYCKSSHSQQRQCVCRYGAARCSGTRHQGPPRGCPGSNRRTQRLTQAEVAAVLGINQPKVSALLHYKLEGFSVERLMQFLVVLGQDLEIVIKHRPRSRLAHIAVKAN
jgi:hypothetical protein